MKQKRFTAKQIAAILQQVDTGMPVVEIIRKTGIAEQTFYRWKKQYGGLQPNEVRE